MSKAFLNVLAIAGLLWAAQTMAQETNSAATPAPATADTINAFLQIQAQLHETQMMVESNREQTIAVLERNAEMLTTDIQVLEKTVADQRINEAESSRRVEQTMLMVGGIGMLALAAVVTMVFLQLRTATRLIELAMAPSSMNGNGRGVLPIVEQAAALPASARAALEFSNARLLGVIERLEKRIIELEDTVRVPIAENGNGNGSSEHENPTNRRVDDLIVEGQLFLDTNKNDKALHCFDTALDIQPDHADVLIKKAAALEKLGQIDEAISCYDRAIALGDSTTTALLQKGGMLNRLARYDEALQCYERALQSQEKKAISV